MNSRDRSILQHIVEYCDKLIGFTEEMDFDEFEDNELCKDACALNILQIGELVRILTDEFKESHASIPWQQIRSMRNIVVYHYGTVDYETVWETIEDDVPALKRFCTDELEKEDAKNNFCENGDN